MMKKYILNKTIYIVSNEVKKEILSYLNDQKMILDIHFFSLIEFIKRCYFDFDYKSIYELSKKYNISFSNAKSFINEMKYLVYSKEINDEKYIRLLEMKNYLDSLGLLQYDNKFLKYLNDYRIVTDLDISSPLINKINELLNNKIEVMKNEINNETIIYEYKDSENEIEDLANKIGNLLTNNISPDKIHILNYSSDYFNYINKIFTLYNIPFSLNNESYLYDLKYVKDLYTCYINEEDIPFIDTCDSINNLVIECINSSSFIEDKDSRNEFLLYLLKNTKIKYPKYKNVVSFDTDIGYFLNDHYYFFIGLNNKVFPKYKKDEDYFSDLNKIDMGYFASYNSNKFMKEFYINKLKSNVNLTISYRKADYFNKYSASDIVNYISNNIVKDSKKENIYSNEYNKLKFTRELDTYYKYNSQSEELKYLLNILNKEEYKKYDNSYTSIDKQRYYDATLNNEISISASSLERFNECNFKYYLNSIIKEPNTTFSTYLGSLFHHVLEKVYEEDFNFDERINNYVSDYMPTDLEKILLKNSINDFKEKVNVIKEQYERTKFKKVKLEPHISINKKAELSINIHGYIDKLMIDEFNRAIVVDYKTGNKKLTLSYLNHGLEIQLPFYFYLINKSKEYADIFLVGCYLQLLNYKIQSITQVKKEMLLEGYSYNNEEIIACIDTLYNNGSYLKGISPNSKGLGTYAKLFDKALFDEIIEKMEVNINNMIQSINNVSFEINPKILKDNSTTCKYCKFKDICFHTFNNYIDLRVGVDDEMDE